MEKYYMTLATSETGTKFTEFRDKCKKAQAEQIAMSEKYGFYQWRGAYWAIEGGLSTVFFKDKPNVKLWKCKDGEYSPRANNMGGQVIKKEFDSMLKVSRYDLNMCIGWDENLNHIGYTIGDNCYGFSINTAKNKTIMPNDCTEITGTEYEQIKDK